MPVSDGTQTAGQLLLTPNSGAKEALPLQRIQPLAEAIGHLATE
jgi:hypothetical protein